MTVLVIRNRQSIRKVRVPFLRRILLSLLEEALAVPSYELAFHLVGPRRMAGLNERFLRHTGSTDVITFDYGAAALARTECSMHGEVFVCVGDAVVQAGRFGTAWQEEVVRYAIHGLLHLQGFDDRDPVSRRKMKTRENRLVRWAAPSRFPPGRLGV